MPIACPDVFKERVLPRCPFSADFRRFTQCWGTTQSSSVGTKCCLLMVLSQLSFYLSGVSALVLVHCEMSWYLGQSLRDGVGPEICIRVYHISIDLDTRIHSVSQAEKQFKRSRCESCSCGEAGHRRGLVFVLFFYTGANISLRNSWDS